MPGGPFSRALDEIEEVLVAAIMASWSIGFIAPFAPRVIPVPANERPAPAPVRQLKVRDTIWPIADAGMSWLKRQGVLQPFEVAGFPTQATRAARTMSKVVYPEQIAKINAEVLESLGKGEGAEKWRERLGRVASVTANLAETIQRTATHTAYHQGLDQILKTPGLEDAFPFWQYFATLDNRTRPEHAAMDSKVFHRESPMAAKAKELLAEWNCRCTLVPMSREDAEAEGIEPGQGGPAGQAEKDTDTDDTTDLEPAVEAKVNATSSRDEEKQKLAALSKVEEKLASYEDANRIREELLKYDPTNEVKVIYGQFKQVEKEKQSLYAEAEQRRLELADKQNRLLRGWKTEGKKRAVTDAATQLEVVNAKLRESIQRAKELAAKAAKAKEDSLAAARAALEVPESSRDQLKLSFDRKVSISSRATSERVMDTMSKMIQSYGDGKNAIPANVVRAADHNLKRSAARPGVRTYFTDALDDDTAAHEFGHHLEARGNTEQVAKEFLARRVGAGAVTRMSEHGSWYQSDEVTYGGDDFAKTFRAVYPGKKEEDYERSAAYTGKQYARWTEVISQGTQMYFRDPIAFAKVDPEWFALIHGAFRGVW